MVPTRTGIEVPSTESTMSARIRVGIAISVSTRRLISVSIHPPTTAAEKPMAMPMAKERQVMTSAMEMVVRAP